MATEAKQKKYWNRSLLYRGRRVNREQIEHPFLKTVRQPCDGLLGEGEDIGREQSNWILLHNSPDFIRIFFSPFRKAYHGSEKIARSHPESQRSRRYSEAEEEIRHQLQKNPEQSFLKASLADLYLRQGRLIETRILIDEVLALDPQHPEALSVLGDFFIKQRSPQKALDCYRQACRSGSQALSLFLNPLGLSKR